MGLKNKTNIGGAISIVGEVDGSIFNKKFII